MRLARLTWLLLPLGGALGCGGEVEKNAEGGAPAMDGECGCGPGGCATGYVAVPNADGCCFHCEPESVCEEQRRLYVEFREATFEEQLESGGCETSDDCVLFDDQTGCSPTCSYAIPRNTRRAIDDRLYAYAEKNCSADCPPQPTPPCDPRPSPECVMGVCQ